MSAATVRERLQWLAAAQGVEPGAPKSPPGYCASPSRISIARKAGPSSPNAT